MKKKEFSEDQIVALLRAHEAGLPVAELCREHGISDTMFNAWQTCYGSVVNAEAWQLNTMSKENRKLRQMLMKSMLEAAMLREEMAELLIP